MEGDLEKPLSRQGFLPGPAAVPLFAQCVRLFCSSHLTVYWLDKVYTDVLRTQRSSKAPRLSPASFLLSPHQLESW